MSDISKDYFDWLCKLIDYGGKVRLYRKTLALLHEQEFIYIMPKDANRYEDGIELRYRYGYEHRISYDDIRDDLDTKPCSVFEMMVALAVRCEDHIMSDPDRGERQSKWFWVMFDNLGLRPMTNSKFKECYPEILEIIDRLNYREYEPDGEGGLFTTSDPTKNMLEEEIWYQMMEYLKNELE